MGLVGLLALAGLCSAALAYLPPLKEHVLSEALLREVVERMGHDLEGYLEEPAYPQLRSDYQENPALRDHEYLQHSSLWANPFSSSEDGDKDETGKGSQGQQQQQQQPSSNRQPDSLPAYCDPPNPCPLGYTAEEGCLEEFENTAAFSRQYQAQQDCMCDSEHMFDCSNNRNPEENDVSESDFDRLVQRLHVEDGHKNSVAKKYQMKKSGNPYLEGEKLPVAAKKGLQVTV